MKNVLIVSPHFPPVNAPDMQRVRMSLPHFEEYGWKPFVLTVAPEYQSAPRDPDLEALLPKVPVTRTRALPLALTRRLGVGDIGLRSAWFLYRAGSALIRRHDIDLVYFSTTVFFAVPLGRLWKQRLGVPYVVDFQDPWVSTYHDDKPDSERPPKYALSSRLHAVLEPWTMRRVSGVIAVSEHYVNTLRQRYPWIPGDACATIPFGASERDFEALGEVETAPAGTPAGEVRAVSIGRGGADLSTALRILFRSAKAASESEPRCSTLRFSFVGTDYATDGRARKSVEPIAAQEGVAEKVREATGRIGYLQSLREMKQADILLLIGSDDQQYSPSKVYPYLLARRPVVAILREGSPLVDLLRRAKAGPVVTFADRDDLRQPVERLQHELASMMRGLTHAPSTDWSVVKPFSARELTRRQCRLFDAVLEPNRAAAVVACAG